MAPHCYYLVLSGISGIFERQTFLILYLQNLFQVLLYSIQLELTAFYLSQVFRHLNQLH